MEHFGIATVEAMSAGAVPVAIGVAAAMGIALGMSKSKASGTKAFATEFQRTCDLIGATRPTAVNLFWALDRMPPRNWYFELDA